jgi:hypothetical protein
MKIEKLIFSFAFIIIFCLSLAAQSSHVGISQGNPKPVKFRRHLAASSAFSYSVINNRKEVRGSYKPGFNAGIEFYTHPWFYWSAEYSYFFPHKSTPGFEDIHAWNSELNGNLVMGMATSSLKFRFIFGATYLKWQGTFVGPDVTDDKTWYIGKRIHQDWLGANLGFGFAYPLGKHFNVYSDFRMRFASEKRDLFSISDTAFITGIQFNPFSPDASRKPANARPSRIYRWLKKRD